MNEVSIRTLNQETSKVMARVKGGEEIAVTERGEVIAHITPASPGPLDSLISAGRVHPATTGGCAHRPTIATSDGPDAGALIQEMRAEERY